MCVWESRGQRALRSSRGAPEPAPTLFQTSSREPSPVELVPVVRPPLLLSSHQGGERGGGEGREDTGKESDGEKNVDGRSEVERDLRSWIRGQGRLEVKGNLEEGWKPTLLRWLLSH